MADYSDDIATAKELIEEFGQDCWWQKPPASDGPGVPGYPGEDGELPDPIKCKIAWFSERDLARGTFQAIEQMLGTEVRAGYLIGLMAGGTSFEPLPTDGVRKGSPTAEETAITAIDIIAPDGTPILYYISVSQ